MRYKHFTQDERNEISILLKKGFSHRDIAYALGKHHSSVSREINNNSVKGQYNPRKAQHKAYVRREYSKYQGMKIRESPELEKYIKEKVKLDWSPEMIAGRLKLETNGRLSLHHTTIYKYFYSSYGQHLCQYLYSRRYHRKSRKPNRKSNRGIIKDRVFIDQRPDIIDQRVRVGDFEGDTLGVPKKSRETIAGLIDRKSRYFLGKKIPRLRETIPAFRKLLNTCSPLSLTIDNGFENKKYKELKVPTYFCHPFSAWEKPTIENTFQRLRRYIPKKSKLSKYSEKDISCIIDKMNNMPRKCLGWKTPKEVFFQKQPLQLKIFNFRCCTSG